MSANRKARKQCVPTPRYYWDYVAETRMGRYTTKIEKDFISKCLATLPERPKIVLDAGAGSGKFEPLITSFASWVIATEVDSSLTYRLARVGDNVVPLLVRDVSESLPLADLSIDCVICVEVPSLTEKTWFYAECQRILKPDGIMIIWVDNRNSWKGILGMTQPKRYHYRLTRYYQESIQDRKRCLKRHGFAIRSAIGLNWVPFPRASDNPLVGFFATLENVMRLHKLVCWSPWVLLEVYKEEEETISIKIPNQKNGLVRLDK